VNRDLFVVARIRKSFGINGEVIVEPFTHSLSRFKKLKEIFIGSDENNVIQSSVSSFRTNKNMIILKIDLFKNRTDSDNYTGSFIYVESKHVVKPPKGKYFHHELIGLSLEDSNGEKFGIVKDVWAMPASDIYVIDLNGKEILIPATKQFIKKVDLGSKKIIINVIAGLIESQV
jgi:16S rRNA processing protein RimM